MDKDLTRFDFDEFARFLASPTDAQRIALDGATPFLSLSIATNLYLKSECKPLLIQSPPTRLLTGVSELADITLYGISHGILGLSPQKSMALSALQHISTPVLRELFPTPRQFQLAFLLTSIVYALSFSLPDNLTPLSVIAMIVLPCLWANFQPDHNSFSIPKPPRHPAYTALITSANTLGFYALQRGFLYYASSSSSSSPTDTICSDQHPEIQSLCEASCDSLSKTYRQTAKIHHPDHGGDAGIMIQLNAVYDYRNTQCSLKHNLLQGINEAGNSHSQ